MVRIIFYRDKCIGCNACVEADFSRWRISQKDGKCNLVGGKDRKGVFMAIASNDEYFNNETAARNCPVKVIKIEKF